MPVSLFNDCTWLYPDTPLAGEERAVSLDAARGGTAFFQALSDASFPCETPVKLSFGADGVSCEAFQLLPAHVEENSGVTEFTTLDYDAVRDFVTRRAPFDVYDVARPLDRGTVCAGRAAFLFLFRVPQSAAVGLKKFPLRLEAGGFALDVEVCLNVCRAVVPTLAEARFRSVNWLGAIPEGHSRADYLESELDFRTTDLLLPGGAPLREGGRVVGFDFSAAEERGRDALSRGFRFLHGAHVASRRTWEGDGLYLNWEPETDVRSIEAFRQLGLYFTAAREMVLRNGWQSLYLQCISDEPHYAGDAAYRALGATARKFMPGTPIFDAVETAGISGAVDVWCVKQAVYDRHAEEFRLLQSYGEELWVYSCGFPAGKWMNRVIDLPLLAGRLLPWLAAARGMRGFLHWGFNFWSQDPFGKTCYPHHDDKVLPAGDGFIVYPGDGRPWPSVRAHVQRLALEEAELLVSLGAQAPALVAPLCGNFENYTSDAAAFAEARRRLLNL